ncbi:helix-turn-helix domain-containing protein [Aestuariivivens sediminis]|uniref:helix-turn-helix domain-containing protein n=1 Tax=Aestuariivivens sediminis TaxID=2913557 RepID=UPI001F5A1501|nr:AraC family transcriptional regulator [Aestuariivivens sediminis]
MVYDFYETMRSDIVFNKFEVDNLLFVEYKCPLEQDTVEIWSQYDYIIYILSGEKTWSTKESQWAVKKGEAIYIKKGASIIKQNFKEEFCMLGIFFSDDIIKSSLKEDIKNIPIKHVEGADTFIIDRIKINVEFKSFFQSLLGYFYDTNKPLNSILQLKAKELLLSLANSKNNVKIASYLKSTTLSDLPSLPNIMEANFHYNLRLEQLAKLCHRSKSSFKRDFKNHYNTSPGKWILERRLKKAAELLTYNLDTISQIAYDCGFESVAHFSRAFKSKYGTTPSSFRKTN